MTLAVSQEMLDRVAQNKPVSVAEYLEPWRVRFPEAVALVQQLCEQLLDGCEEYVDFNPQHVEQGLTIDIQRLMAPAANKVALATHFGVGVVDFQACHRILVAMNPDHLFVKQFQSMEDQLYNQRREALDC
jgi:hypothetical protein